MIKKLAIATLYSFIAFCVISYLSIMISLLDKQPVANLGFPFRYYYQFWLRGSDRPNCGWEIDHFIYDAALAWVLTLLVYFFIKRKKSRPQ